jgi:hypothetical protein
MLVAGFALIAIFAALPTTPTSLEIATDAFTQQISAQFNHLKCQQEASNLHSCQIQMSG